MDKEMQQHILDVSTNFRRGSAEMLLLSLLSQGDRYPYELSKELKTYSGGLFDIQGPSLYTVLYRLEQKKYLSTREVQVGRRIRVYYHLLPAGAEVLEAILREYRNISKGIENVLDSVHTGALRKEDANVGPDTDE